MLCVIVCMFVSPTFDGSRWISSLIVAFSVYLLFLLLILLMLVIVF